MFDFYRKLNMIIVRPPQNTKKQRNNVDIGDIKTPIETLRPQGFDSFRRSFNVRG